MRFESCSPSCCNRNIRVLYLRSNSSDRPSVSLMLVFEQIKPNISALIYTSDHRTKIGKMCKQKERIQVSVDPQRMQEMFEMECGLPTSQMKSAVLEQLLPSKWSLINMLQHQEAASFPCFQSATAEKVEHFASATTPSSLFPTNNALPIQFHQKTALKLHYCVFEAVGHPRRRGSVSPNLPLFQSFTVNPMLPVILPQHQNNSQRKASQKSIVQNGSFMFCSPSLFYHFWKSSTLGKRKVSLFGLNSDPRELGWSMATASEDGAGEGCDGADLSLFGERSLNRVYMMAEGGQASKQILEILHAQHPAVRQFDQSFSYAQLTITHEHTVEVQIAENAAEKMEIRNHYSVREGERLVKLTEVHFQNRIVRIYDNLALLPLPSTRETRLVVEEREEKGEKGVKGEKGAKGEKGVKGVKGEERDRAEKRKEIIKRRARQMGTNRDTKNVVKNILRMFKNWLKGYPREMAICSSFFEKRKFNNSLVFAIAYEPTPRKAFISFLENSASKMLQESKVQDKSAHLSALQNYRSLCLELQEGKTANPRSMLLPFPDAGSKLSGI